MLSLAEGYKYDPGSGRALSKRRKDRAGTVIALERDDLWHDVVKVACTHHVGTTHIGRERLLADLAGARGKGESVELTLAH